MHAGIDSRLLLECLERLLLECLRLLLEWLRLLLEWLRLLLECLRLLAVVVAVSYEAAWASLW